MLCHVQSPPDVHKKWDIFILAKTREICISQKLKKNALKFEEKVLKFLFILS